MRRALGKGLTIAALVAGCVAPPAEPPVGAMRLDGAYGTGTATFTRRDWQVDYAYTVTNYGGMTAICGNKYLSPGIDPDAARQSLGNLVLSIDSREIRRDFTFFTDVDRKADLLTRPAGCIATAVPWSDRMLRGRWKVDYVGPERIGV